MDYTSLQYAFYVLSPTFLASVGILMTMLGVALMSILIDTISYSQIAVAHMIIFEISLLFFDNIPFSIAIDILVTSFCILCSIKALGSIFVGFGRGRYVFESWVFWSLVIVCISALLRIIEYEGGNGQMSVAVQSLRKVFKGVGIEDEILWTVQQAVSFFMCVGIILNIVMAFWN
jgi:hypothetical protein